MSERRWTALDALALKKVVNILSTCISQLPTASFYSRELGLAELERELIEIQDACVGNRITLLELLAICPALPEDNKKAAA